MVLPTLTRNILLRQVLGDGPEHSPRSTALRERSERGELEAQLSDIPEGLSWHDICHVLVVLEHGVLGYLSDTSSSQATVGVTWEAPNTFR